MSDPILEVSEADICTTKRQCYVGKFDNAIQKNYLVHSKLKKVY